MRRALTLALALALPAIAAPKRSVTVAAAANLKPALEQLAPAFEAKNPGVELKVTLGASGTLFAQLEHGAPFDVFLAADAEFPAKVVSAKLADGAAVTYATGKLVLWVPPGSKLDIEKRGLEALTDASVLKAAIGNPGLAPYGAAAEQALKAAGVHEKVKGKLVLGRSVAQAAQFAHSGNAQAALLPRSLVLAPPLSEGRWVAVPESAHARIEQAGVVLKTAKEPELARAFVRFVLGAEGRAILEKCGYGLPPE